MVKKRAKPRSIITRHHRHRIVTRDKLRQRSTVIGNIRQRQSIGSDPASPEPTAARRSSSKSLDVEKPAAAAKIYGRDQALALLVDFDGVSVAKCVNDRDTLSGRRRRWVVLIRHRDVVSVDASGAQKLDDGRCRTLAS